MDSDDDLMSISGDSSSDDEDDIPDVRTSRRSGIARPCSISVAQLRKAVTATRRANHIVGPANREQLMHIGEQHADMDGKPADRIRTAYMERSPILVPDLREMRGEVKLYYHPPVSKMNMAALESYVYWTAKDLDWTWSGLDGLAPKKRQPRGCRGSAAPGGRSRDAPVRQKRKPTAYNLFIRQYFAENYEDRDDAREIFSEAVGAWKAQEGRRAGRKAGAAKAKATRTYRAEVLDDQRRNKTKRVAARTKRNRAAQQDEFDRRGEDPVVQFVRRTRIPKKRRE